MEGLITIVKFSMLDPLLSEIFKEEEVRENKEKKTWYIHGLTKMLIKKIT